MNKLLLVGGGGHARDIYGLIEDINAFNAVPIIVTAILDDWWGNTERFNGCNVELVTGIKENLKWGDKFIICIGYPGNRKILNELALESGLTPFDALIHPSANLGKNLKISNGSAIFGATSVSPNVKVGRNSVIHYGASIGHDTSIGDNVSIMPGAIISGDVMIGSNVLIGTGAIVLEKI